MEIKRPVMNIIISWVPGKNHSDIKTIKNTVYLCRTKHCPCCITVLKQNISCVDGCDTRLVSLGNIACKKHDHTFLMAPRWVQLSWIISCLFAFNDGSRVHGWAKTVLRNKLHGLRQKRSDCHILLTSHWAELISDEVICSKVHFALI